MAIGICNTLVNLSCGWCLKNAVQMPYFIAILKKLMRKATGNWGQGNSSSSSWVVNVTTRLV